MVKAALALIFSLWVACVATGVGAQQSQSPKKSESAKTARPLWSELSPQQQHVLGPLAADWENLDTTRRKKWVTIANRYPKMQPDEQMRLQNRMQAWATLTPAERREARENYKTLRQLPRPPRGELRQKWDQHKQAPVPAPEAAAGDTPGK